MTLKAAKDLLKPKLMPMREGFLYEPRAFWGVGSYDNTTPSTRRPPGTIRLPREFFYNGERFPITLLYALVSPIGYTFDVYGNTVTPNTAAGYRNCGAAAINDAQLAIGSPGRQQYMRIPGLTQSLPPLPRWEPPVRDLGGSDIVRSPANNVFSWEFSSPMVIPGKGSLEFELSRFTSPGFASPPAAQATVGFQEIGALAMKGAARIQSFPVAVQEVPAGVASLYAPDGFGFLPGNANQIWSPGQSLSAKNFTHQNQSSDGSVPIVGWSVMINQQAYDDVILATVPIGTTPGRIASLGTRIGTRARMRQGGSGAYWWREGAPLALVAPHRTPAQVHELRTPITLGPGDELEVELTLPESVVLDETTYNRVTQIGVSLCGYASIEG